MTGFAFQGKATDGVINPAHFTAQQQPLAAELDLPPLLNVNKTVEMFVIFTMIFLLIITRLCM